MHCIINKIICRSHETCLIPVLFSLSSAFRQARIHVTTGDIFSIEEPDMSVEDKFKFVHDVLAPEMYQVKATIINHLL